MSYYTDPFEDEDDGFEEAAEQWVLERFIPHPEDYFYWLLDRVSEQELSGYLEKVREVLAFYEKGPTFALTPDALAVLRVLDESPTTMIQTEIAGALEGTEWKRSRKTIAAILNRLKAQGLVDRPVSERKGYAITEKGREYLKRAGKGHND